MTFQQLKKIFNSKIILYSLITIFLLLFENVHGQTIQELLNKTFKLSPPYLIINIKSDDCIMCRGAALSLMEKMKFKNKVIILFDDSVMMIYHDKNIGKFSMYSVVYNKDISYSLSKEPLSTAYLVMHSGINKYIISNISTEQINEINSYMDTVKMDIVKKSKEYAFLKFSNSNFIADKKSSLLFNFRNQIGFYSNVISGVSEFMEPDCNEMVESKLQKFIQTSARDTISRKLEKAILGAAGLSSILVKNIEFNERISIGLQLNTVKKTTHVDDTLTRYGVLGKFFVGFGPEDIQQALNINLYNEFYLIDTFHFQNLFLLSDPSFGYQTFDNKIYMPFLKVDSSMHMQNPRMHYLLEMTFNKDSKKPLPEKIYELKDFDINPTENIDVKISGEGYPIIIYKNKGVVYYTKFDEHICFSEMLKSETVDSDVIFCDLDITGQTLNGTFLKNGNKLIIATYDLKSRKANLKTIPLEKSYISGKFIHGFFRLYTKDPVKGYEFYDCKLM